MLLAWREPLIGCKMFISLHCCWKWMPPISQYLKILCHVTCKQHVAPGRVPSTDVPFTKKLRFHPFKCLPLNSILGQFDPSFNMITGLKGNTRVIKSGLQQASHHIIPSTWASNNQSAQHIRIPHQLVQPHTMISEWDHDLHQRVASLRPGSPHAFLQDPNRLYQNSLVFYSAHATKCSWISPQMTEVAIHKVKEKKSKSKGDQWWNSYNYVFWLYAATLGHKTLSYC